jgi:hypothetical protein
MSILRAAIEAHGPEHVYETSLRILGYPAGWIVTPGEARPLIAALAAGD